VGHLFQVRYKAILVDKDSYLLELSRYVVLNPVRVGMVEHPGDWPWSRFGARVGDAPVPGWLATDGLLAQFGRRRKEARRCCRKFVAEGGTSIWSGLRQRIYLADDTFAAKMQGKIPVQTDQLNIPRGPSAEGLRHRREEYRRRVFGQNKQPRDDKEIRGRAAIKRQGSAVDKGRLNGDS